MTCLTRMRSSYGCFQIHFDNHRNGVKRFREATLSLYLSTLKTSLMTPDTIYQDQTDPVDEILDSFYFSIEEEEAGINDDDEQYETASSVSSTQSEGLSELESESDEEAGAFYALYGGGSSVSSSISSLSSMSAPRERVDLSSESIEAAGIFDNSRDDDVLPLDTYRPTNDSSLIFGHEDIPQVISASSNTCDEGVLSDDHLPPKFSSRLSTETIHDITSVPYQTCTGRNV
ncbi:uncharacterized protein EV420DRAFT_41122 [Desarmillaria tabescens]|uniref:Uncharacterized protein n=1 Tax=Armillaria tabescens TaxID=1929756 RepID=A0AA39U2U8_ARMTA|nr:uncharacterized protein EV420DRAFT_41122 [Desarmillaria tabescens]KAK0469544.1 hypothetical protein EV420DRAFT_41122 [Desarmillaria tabescens]